MSSEFNFLVDISVIGREIAYATYFHIIDVLVDDFLRDIMKLEDSLEDLEEIIFNNRKTSEEAKKINLLRREVQYSNS